MEINKILPYPSDGSKFSDMLKTIYEREEYYENRCYELEKDIC